MHIYIYIYAYTYIYTYMHIYIYTYAEFAGLAETGLAQNMPNHLEIV